MATYQLTNSFSQTVALYPQAIDSNFAVLQRLGDMFAPHAQSSTDMTISLDAGHIFDGTNLTEIAAQIVGAFSPPVSAQRIDRVVIDRKTGLASIISGLESITPTPPSIPAGKLPVAQIILQTTTSTITNEMITDERSLEGLGLGTTSYLNTGSTVINAGTGTLEVATPAITRTGTNYTYTASDRGSLVKRSNSGTVMSDKLPGSDTGIMASGWFVTIANDDTSSLMSIEAGTGAVINGAPMGFIILGPNQQATIMSDGGNYSVVQMPSRVRLGANTTIYVATTGSNSSTAIAPSVPYATIQKAVDTVALYYDFAGYSLTIQLANGTYTSGFTVSKNNVGGNDSLFIINGNASSPGSVVLSTTNASAAAALRNGTGFTIQNLTLQTTSGGHTLVADRGSCIYFSNIIFGPCAGYHIYALRHSSIYSASNYSISGGAAYHLASWHGGLIAYDSATSVTISGTPSFSSAFASTLNTGIIAVNLVAYSGSATGKRYDATTNSVISTGGGGANFFPGNTAGTTTTGGIYY